MGGVNTYYDPDGDIRLVVYSNDTVANEPVYWLDNGSYDIAYAPATMDDATSEDMDGAGVDYDAIAMDSLILEQDLYIYEDEEYRLNKRLTSRGSTESTP